MTTEEMKPITIIESIPGQLAVQNRKLDINNPLDAAILEFLFKFNLRQAGLSREETERLWVKSPWCPKFIMTKDAVEGLEKYYEDNLGNPMKLNPKG